LIWVVESGEYTNRGVDFLAVSIETALAHMRKTYQAPYVVSWEELEQEDENHWSVSIRWTAAQDYSVNYWKYFDLTCHKVVED